MHRFPFPAIAVVFVMVVRAAFAEEELGGGEPWEGAEAVRSSTATLMFDTRAKGAESREFKRKPHFVREFDRLQVNPESPVTAAWPPQSVSTPITESIQTPGVSFTGATLYDTLAFPPDSMGAVGPAQFIVAVNGRIRTFTKQGAPDGVMDIGTDSFFASVMTPPLSSNFTSDPRIRYDRLSRRWFIVMIDVPSGGTLPNRVMIAVSDSSVITPSTVWSFYYFRHDQVSPAGDSNYFADYPTLGIDANALYIGVNLFGGRQGSFVNTSAFVVRKSSLLNGGPIVATAFRKLISNSPNTSGPYTPQGVDNYDPNATEGYLIGADANFYGKLQLRRISNPGGTPTISSSIAITVPVNGNTMTVPHLGNTGGSAGNLDGLDYRLLAAHIRNGRLWTSANMAVDNNGLPGNTDTRNAVRWYELQGIGTGQTPSVVQSGTLYQPSAANTLDQRHYWMGTVMVSGQGHAALGFSAAGANEHINAGTAGRLASDPLGTMQPPVLYTATSASYNPPSDPGSSSGRRWGDYSYTSLDPNDDMTMWTIQEFCDNENSYGVRVVQLLAPPPARPAGCSPASIVAGATNVSITVTGAIANGSGFFDPGPGFSNQLAAGFGPGVTVQSITYNNPSNLSVTVSASLSASSDARYISIVNPDGQSATSTSALFTVIGGTGTNRPPALANITNLTVAELSSITFVAAGTDLDGDSLTYALAAGAPSGAAINPITGAFTWTPSELQGPSTNVILVVVTDNGAPALSSTQSFNIVVQEVNLPPTLSPISSKSVAEGGVLSFTNIAADADLPANVLTFSLAPGAPTNMNLSTSGVLSWTTTEVQGPSTNTVSVIVTDDGAPPLSATQTFNVIVTEENSAPMLAALSDFALYPGETVAFQASAIDNDIPGNVLSYSLEPGGPAEASISSSGAFTWTPSPTNSGHYTIGVRVMDDGVPPLSDTKSFDVLVYDAPLITAVVADESHVRINWVTVPGRTYKLQSKTEITGAWDDVPGVIPATGTTADRSLPLGAEQQFYRVLALP